FDDEGNGGGLPLRLGASPPAPGTCRGGCRLMTSSRVVAGMVGNRSRMADTSTVMSVVFMTTAAWAWRANAGETGRASTDIARRTGRGGGRGGAGRAAAGGGRG